MMASGESMCWTGLWAELNKNKKWLNGALFAPVQAGLFCG